eukprot:COSAG02_NODE_61705_length_268_cov_0.514793_1_plen_44_part_01
MVWGQERGETSAIVVPGGARAAPGRALGGMLEMAKVHEIPCIAS